MDYELKFMVWPLRLYIANFYITEPVEVVFKDIPINFEELISGVKGINPPNREEIAQILDIPQSDFRAFSNHHVVNAIVGLRNRMFINNGVPFSFSKELADKFIEWGIARLATEKELFEWSKSKGLKIYD